jgi:dephospho-CoA kinase
MKLRIGITGGIGSGKSIVSHLFSLLGIPVYNADAAARTILDTNTALQSDVLHAFGEQILNNNVIDRSKLAAIVFHDEAKLKQLNALIHPYVFRDFEDWENNQQSPYTLREAAILFETGIWKQLDHIILVDAPEEIRLQRVQQRDNRSRSEIEAIFRRQWSSSEKRKLAWRIIENDEKHLVLPQVIAIHSELMHGR